jgi:hypothetical protein
LLFVQDTGLKMTPVTLELVIDDSKRERKREGIWKTIELVSVLPHRHASTLNRLRAPSRVNENAGASLMNGEMDE